MSVAILPYDSEADRLHRLRVDGGVTLEISARQGRSVATHVREADGHRVRFPQFSSGGELEALLLNTGGGLAGGDRVRHRISCGPDAIVTIGTVGAERIYRAQASPTDMAIDIVLAPGSRMAWLPQEAIVYTGARFRRRVTADIAEDAALTFLDISVFGRKGSSERVTTGLFDDQWLIRRGGRLLHVEAVKIEGDMDAALMRPAVAGGAHIVGTLVHVSPEGTDHIDGVRAIVGESADVMSAASTWKGKVVVRALGRRADKIKAVMMRVVEVLTNRPPSRVWLY